MTPDQAPEPASVTTERPETPGAVRRGRRSGRGRRGRGRRPPQAMAQPPSAPAGEAVELTQPATDPTQAVAAPAPVERETPPPPIRERRPASPASVQQAIEEVTRIIETLRGTLDDMEEVLETLELAERQKIADEQEIETLRRGLRQLNRPREGGPYPPRH
jgi:hypothetical protein